MPVQVVVGAQWGDEGKGKIVDLLSEHADLVVRCQGGANAGHSIWIDSNKYVLHLIPSGILHPHTICYIGNGVVVDPEILLEEVHLLESKGISARDRLFVSPQAHLVLPIHKVMDVINEKMAGNSKIGTTKRGIGPAYSDKIARVGFRAGDLKYPDVFRKKYHERLNQLSHSFTQLDSDQKLDIEQLISDALKMGKEMLPFLADVSIAVDNAIKANKRVLIEGAQGTLLDIDFGTYPFVTSSNSTSGGACTGVGVGPTKINEVIGIIKAYTTRVGMGPFPTELTDEAGENLQKIGKEFGATTGRPRRCGWFDTVVARYAARVNGVTSFALTKLDILDSLAEIPICIGYQYNDELLTEFPTDLHVLENCHPVYESMPGWQSDTTDLTEYEQLPQAAKNYIHKLETLCGIRFSIISVGPDRKNTLFLK